MNQPVDVPAASPLKSSSGLCIPQRSLGVTENLQLIADQLLMTSHNYPKYREKRWFFFGVINPAFIAGAAVVHLGYLGNCFGYIWDRERKQLHESTSLIAPGPWLSIEPKPLAGSMRSFSWSNSMRGTPLSDSGYRVEFNSHLPWKLFSMHWTFNLDEHRKVLLQAINPVDDTNWAYTAKLAGFIVQGEIRIGRRSFPLDSSQTFGVADWTLGYHARRTSWYWAAACGTTASNENAAFNFSSRVYDRGEGENIVWVDNQPFLLGKLSFKLEPDGQTWRLEDDQGLLQLQFVPEGLRAENVNVLVIASQFKQFLGRFTGHFTDPQGIPHQINASGFLEDHNALW